MTPPAEPAPWPRWTPAVIAAGALAGLLARNVPVDLAARFTRGRSVDCVDRTILECTLDNAGPLAATLFRFLVTLLVIEIAAALVALVLLVIGRTRRQPWFLAVGTAVAVPMVWQAVAIGWSVLA